MPTRSARGDADRFWEGVFENNKEIIRLGSLPKPNVDVLPELANFKNSKTARRAAGAPCSFLVVSAKKEQGIPRRSPTILGILEGVIFFWCFQGGGNLEHFSVYSGDLERKSLLFLRPR